MKTVFRERAGVETELSVLLEPGDVLRVVGAKRDDGKVVGK